MWRMIYFGWLDLSPELAADMDLDQPARWRWQGFHIGAFGVGLIVAVRCKGPRP